MLFNPISTIVLLASIVAFGPSWLFVVLANYVFGVFAGNYCAAQVRRYDQANRAVIRKNAGHKAASGDSETLEKWIVGANRLAPFMPIIPIISVGVGFYCHAKAKSIERRGEVCTEEAPALHPMFTAPGRFVLR